MKKIFFSLFLFPLIFSNMNVIAQGWVNGGNNLPATGRMGTTSNQSVAFITNNTERGRVNTSGNWGFGIASPTERVHINSASGASALRVAINGSTKLLVHSGGGVSVGSSSTPPANGLYVSGNVGLGTTTPSAKLQVIGSTALNTSGIVVSGYAYGIQASSTGAGFGVSAISDNIGVYGSGGYAGLSGYGSAASGSYGVLGSAATYGVYGSATTYGVYGSGAYGLYASSTVGGGDGVHSNVSGSNNYGVNSYSSDSYGLFASTGVSGGIAGFFSGSVYSTGTYQGSDAKLKKNITGVNNAMDIINKLQPKNYEYRNDGNFAKMNLPTGQHYGFIAQDLEKVLPNLVKETNFNVAKTVQPAETPSIAPLVSPVNGIITRPQPVQPIKETKGEKIDFKAVNYIELIPIIVKAMQEQQTMIQSLKDINANLQNQLNDLKSLILKNGNSSVTSSLEGYLQQNTPNPANNSTVIGYYTPGNTKRAQILVTDMKGSVLKVYSVSGGAGQVNISNNELPVGTYNYTLYVNANKVDTKQMVIMR